MKIDSDKAVADTSSPLPATPSSTPETIGPADDGGARVREQLLARLGRFKDAYPYLLDAKFPRIVEKIAQLWDTDQITPYFTGLLMDERGGRKGFPPEIAREIFELSITHDKIKALSPEPEDIWDHEREKAKQQIEQLNIKLAPADMLRAAESADPARVTLFLQAGMPVDARDERGWTALMVAAFNGNEAVAMILTVHGADPNARDRGGYTPLHWAALNGYDSVVKLLIKKGVDRDARSNFGLTALLQAATKGHTQVVETLLLAGADPNLVTHDGWSPLHKAAANGHTQSLRALIKSGASVHAKHNDGSTALSLAEKHNFSVIRDILEGKNQEEHY